MSGATSPRAGVPAATMPTPMTRTATTMSPTRAAPRRRPAPPLRPVASRVANRPSSSAADRGSGTRRSRIGRAAHTTTRPASSPTLVPNSLVCGAIRSVLATATRTPNTTRPTRPAGTVFGSVIMKNRKIRTSGEVTITRQKSKPQTGAKAQFAVMQWPEPARSPTPTASATQNVAASASRCSRRVISSPPTMITA